MTWVILIFSVYREVSKDAKDNRESARLLSAAKLILKQLITRVKVRDRKDKEIKY